MTKAYGRHLSKRPDGLTIDAPGSERTLIMEERRSYMKIRRIISYATIVAAFAGVSFPVLGQVSIQFGHEQQPPPPQYQQQPRYQSNWNDDQKRELRHIYYRLEHASQSFDGYRENALREIRTAAELMGMDLRGSGYAQQWQGSQSYGGYGQQPQSEESSEQTLHRAHDRLIDLAHNTGDPVRRHLVDAAHELDMALVR
jgi:hypothetical protein